MTPFKRGDRVRIAGSSAPTGTVDSVSEDGRIVHVQWRERSTAHKVDDLTHAPTPFRKGDRVEHVENNHGFVMTVVADQYTSGAVLTEWPNGKRHTEWAKFLRHAEPTVKAGDKIGSFVGGHIHFETPGGPPIKPVKISEDGTFETTLPTPTIHEATMSALHKKWDTGRKYRDDDPSNPTPESDPNYANTIREDLNATVTALGGDPVSEDVVNHPKHYTSDPSGVECIQITRHRNFNIGSALKYLWRAGLKGDSSMAQIDKQIEDLRKSIFYINDEIQRIATVNSSPKGVELEQP